ncbi:MAG: porin [Planctomycetota bacterium]
MKKLVFSACALTLTSASAIANDGDWAQLDEDVQALSASLQDLEEASINFGGRIRAMYEYSSDIQPNDGSANFADADLGGFAVYNARLYAHGTTFSNIGYRLEYDFAENAAGVGGTPGVFQNGLLDAYIDIPIGANITIRAGRFRAFVLNESRIDSGNLFFVDRAVTAILFAGRENGIAVAGDFDAFEWAVTVQNGEDNLGDDLFYAVRGGIDFLGEGTKLMEGAYGAGEDLEASAGVAYFNNDALDDGDGFAVEASLAGELFSVNASLVSLGDEVGLANIDLQERIPGLSVGDVRGEADATPFSVSGTFMLVRPDANRGGWELGARYQNLDDDEDTFLIDLGVNYYVDGHNMKYIFNYTKLDSDDSDFEADVFRIGVNTRF